MTASDESLSQSIDRNERLAAACAVHFRKLRGRIAQAKKALAARPSTKELAKQIAEIRSLSAEPERPDLDRLASELEEHANQLRQTLRQSFTESLRDSCAAESLPFQLVGDGVGIGTMYLAVDPTREEATLHFAKHAVVAGLPLDAEECVQRAKEIQVQVLNEPVDLAKTRARFEEAVRVAGARKNKSWKNELRVELPQLFREMEFIRRTESKPSGKAAVEYGLPRFVVEICRLVQSDENLRAARPFRLETAVLENTKDARRSIFLPKDLRQSFGEGTYFQALLLSGE